MRIGCQGWWPVLALSVIALAGCATTESRPVAQGGDAAFVADGELTSTTAPDVGPVSSAPEVDAMPSSNIDEYVIGPHDLLEISVFQVEELSRTVRINSRGMFSLPLIGVIQAAGLTAADVEADIAGKLYECCLQDPQVSIFIKEFVSQRVTVEGEVQKPGVYPLTGRTTLLQAIAMASGSSELADLGEVRVFRDLKDGMKEQFVFDIRQIREGKVADPLIQGNDIVVVGKSGSLSVIKGVTDTLRGFIGFGTVR